MKLIVGRTTLPRSFQPAVTAPAAHIRLFSTQRIQPLAPAVRRHTSRLQVTTYSPQQQLRAYTTPAPNVDMTVNGSAGPAPTRILVVGGSYAGLSATVNLIDLGNHVNARYNYPNYTHDAEAPRTPVEITLVDERDGFCKFPSQSRDFLAASPVSFAV